MYHIKADKRSRTSAGLICQAVLELLAENPGRQISISDIQRCSTVSRSTFYRCFDSVEDVLALLCDRGFHAALKDRQWEGSIPERVFHYWYNNSTVLEALVYSGRTDILVGSLRRCIPTMPLGNRAKIDYLTAMICYSMAGILVTWVERGKKESEQELLAAVKSSFSTLNALIFKN